MIKPIDRILYTEGQNGIIRLPADLWKAFYEAALYLGMDSVQECFRLYLEKGGSITLRLSWDDIAWFVERNSG